MNTLSMIQRTVILVLLGCCTAVAQATTPFAAAQRTVTFSIESQPVREALMKFGQQTGLQVLFRSEGLSIQGVTAAPVSGALSAQEALRRLLAKTGLTYEFVNERTVRVSAAKPAGTASAAPQPGGAGAHRLRLVQNAPPGATAEVEQKVEQPPTRVDEIEVVDRRLDGLINTGLLQTGAEAPLYHNVITREDIERLGVTNMEELFRFIPQTTSAETYAQGEVGSQIQIQERTSTISLRGFPSSQTVVLVNGRALPRSGESGGGGADINRIPLAAIERIEILPYAGSAIYGAGAIGGAVNVILRKNYSGRDLTANFGTSVNGGAEEYSLTYVDGRNFNDGRTTLTLTANLQRRAELRLGDRDYLDRAIGRYGPTSTARIGSGALVFESMMLPTMAGAPATIVMQTATGDLGIPGHPGVRYATVPVGTSPAQSLTLTPNSFIGTAGNYSTGPSRYDRMMISVPRDTYSVNAQVEHAFIPRRLEAYGEFTLGLNQVKYSAPEAASLNLTTADTLNPFGNSRTDGLPARAVTVHFDTPDIPDASYDREFQSGRAVLGLRGSITDKWEWSADGLIDYTDSDQTALRRLTHSSLTSFLALTPADTLEARRAVYALLADHDAFPIAVEAVDAYFGGGRRTTSRVLQKEGNLRLTGDLYALPAGQLRTSFHGMLRHFERSSAFYTLVAPEAIPLLGGDPSIRRSPILSKRETMQGAVELAVPIFGKSWQPVPFIQGLDLNLSYSTEENSTAGINQSSQQPFDFTGKRAETYVAALKLQIVPDIALRGSYTEGFYPADWGDVSDFDLTGGILGIFADPLRGNTALSSEYTAVTVFNGGNPNVRPESAKSSNIGVLLKPRFAPGLTLTLDYWRTKKTDAIIRTNFFGILLGIADYDASSIERAEPTPEEAAMGWSGLITRVNAGPINISTLETDGADINIRYDYDAGAYGSFLFNTNASFTNHFQTRTLPSSRLVETASAGGPNRWRGYTSVGWNRAGFGTTLTGRYVGKYVTNSNAPSSAFPNASGLDGPYMPAFTIYDLQLNYVVHSARGGMLQGLLDGSQWTLGINNLFDKTPNLVTDGQAFYNRQIDPRQRFMYVSYRKNF
jgi:outer membrane receptor protein involved in Fe transport